MMDHNEAYSDTHIDVNLMILDYLLCTTIETIVCTGVEGGEHHDLMSIDSSIDAVEGFKSLTPQELIPGDIQTKYHILQVANAFCRPAAVGPVSSAESTELQPHTKQAPKTLGRHTTPSHFNEQTLAPPPKLCAHFICIWKAIDTKKLHPKYASFVEQLIVHMILKDHQALEDSLQDIVRRHFEWDNEVLDLSQCPSPEFIKSLKQPTEVSLREHLTISSENMPSRELRGGLSGLFQTIMKRFEPPVLVQLEQGKLYGMSRTETQQLKTSLGMC